ncbi:Unknown protein [Striga hermonthica]|uniref:Uncharacterized protein n=1 Tax=Striga hermonthica TaxID=68872 RepID=A0A9N7RR57_STRHE|nr:Unknown protein [Striga hermonthica]
MKQERYDIHCDSQSAMDLSKNVMYHSRTKHIDVKYHWLHQAVEEQQFKLEKIHTDDNPADMMTKVVTGGKLQLCAELIGMECIVKDLIMAGGRHWDSMLVRSLFAPEAADEILKISSLIPRFDDVWQYDLLVNGKFSVRQTYGKLLARKLRGGGSG